MQQSSRRTVLVLAIGLVVDDAIIVVENVDRHMKEEGKSPMQAALIAARELGSPILAMTVVLIAVYVPIGFQGGLTGALFTEFAFTLAGAVAVSGVVALTLSPMMASRFFRPEQDSGRFAQAIDRVFDRVRHGHGRALHGLLDTWPVLIVMAVLLSCLLGLMFKMSQSELSPEEDQGFVGSQVVGPPTATSDQMQTYADQIFKIAKTEPEYSQMFQITGVPTVNQGIGGVLFKPWDQRTRSAHELQQDLQEKWNKVAGGRVAAFQFPSLPGASGLPVQFVISSTEPFENLNTVAQQVLDKARTSGKFYFVDVDLKIDKPQATVVVDRDKIAALGMTQQDVGASLGAALGGGYVNYFSIAGRSYKVIPQVQQVDRLNPADVLDFYIKTPTAGLIPASTVASIKYDIVPESITRFQQLNSVTISGVSGASQGEVLQFLRDTVKQVAPSGYNVECAIRLPCGSVCGRRPEGLLPSDALMSEDPVGRHFAEAARLEAASIPAFHRLARELTVHGAPRSLVERARAAGKLRATGASVYGPDTALAAVRTGKIQVLQVALSLLDQRMCRQVLPEAEAAGIGCPTRDREETFVAKKVKKLKLKTHRGAAKRFKITATGKVMRMHSGKRHLLGTKKANRMRRLKKLKQVHHADAGNVHKMLPYG